MKLGFNPRASGDHSLIRRLTLPCALMFLFSVATPATAQPKIEDFLGSCSENDKFCEGNLAQFKKWFPLAWRRDYQGQRNVAFCLRDGCDGAVVKNPTLACAWRMVILGSASTKIDQSDFANFRIACGVLDTAQRSVARGQANDLMRAIYRKPIPADLEVAMLALPTPR
ncbi:MAG: hypothetical protein IOC54_01395 [Methylobacterium sp.]|nr:hypothetical protein [Methylobacterium sp.]MCA3650475.1 hypothetical protein [Methylobacterium sp.]MCA4923356.1 hypothetical protein [Methylobacterium sp.]